MINVLKRACVRYPSSTSPPVRHAFKFNLLSACLFGVSSIAKNIFHGNTVAVKWLQWYFSFLPLLLFPLLPRFLHIGPLPVSASASHCKLREVVSQFSFSLPGGISNSAAAVVPVSSCSCSVPSSFLLIKRQFSCLFSGISENLLLVVASFAFACLLS